MKVAQKDSAVKLAISSWFGMVERADLAELTPSRTL